MNVLIAGFLISLGASVRSDNGLFYASIEYRGSADFITESFVLYDRSGTVLYSKKDVAVNTFFICNTGNVFALSEHDLFLYQVDGSEMLLRELVYPNGFGFSRDNSLFFASDREGLFVYSYEGVLVHTYRSGRLFASTGNGESVAVISADTLFSYHNGSLIDTELLPSPYARDVCFSVDAESIKVKLPGTVEVYNTRTKAWLKQR